jgi:lipopolysaccharide transport system permease protein
MTADVIARRDLLFNLTRAELTARYRSTLLGVLWFVLTPLILMVVLTIIFSNFIRLGIPNYPVFVLTGLLPYTFFQVGLLNSTTSVTRAGGLIKRARMPRIYLPLAAIGANLIHYLVALVLLVPLMLAFGIALTPGLLLLPLAIALAVVAVAGLGMLTAALNVAHRDVELLVSATSRVLFYLSPVFYPLSSVPEQWQPLYLLNPMAGVIEMHRSILMTGQLPPPFVVTMAVLTCIAALILGALVFRRRQADFEDYL